MPLVAPVSATATAPAFVLCYAGCMLVHSGMSGSNSNICMYTNECMRRGGTGTLQPFVLPSPPYLMGLL